MHALRPVLLFPSQADAMPEVGYSVSEGPLCKGPTWSEAEVEMSDSYSAVVGVDDMSPLLSTESVPPSMCI